MLNIQQLEQKWGDLLEAEDAPKFKSKLRRNTTAILLENEERALVEQNGQTSYQGINEDGGVGNMNTQAGISTWDPVLISLVRRSMPNLIAYDVAGVQAMTAPSQLIFAMRAKYPAANLTTTNTDTGAQSYYATGATDEALFDEIRQHAPASDTMDVEGDAFNQMGFTVDKINVVAKARQLKAEYTMELAQDLKSIHGLDAEAELANILSTEILAEINQEIIGGITSTGVTGGNAGKVTADFTDAAGNSYTVGATIEGAAYAALTVAERANVAGYYDLQLADGRWAEEKFRSLLFQIELEANAIARTTRRGKGNFLICSANVASALAAAGVMTYAPDLQNALEVDATGNTFAGTINGRMKVFVDPYSSSDYCTVGYKGANGYDAGIFYCPYVPLTMLRAQAENTFQPKIAFKTRYGLVVNPFVAAGTDGSIGSAAKKNVYFRTFKVLNIFDTTT